MNYIKTAAAIVVAGIATPVFAQDATTVAGPRVEATIGWDRVVLNVDDESAGKSGVTYGGEVGFDFAPSIGTIVGVYAGIDGSSTEECYSEGTERACLKAGRNITVSARVGGRIGSSSLAYLKGGYSNGRLRAVYTDTSFPGDNFAEGGNMDGFHAGAGIQVGLRGGVYGKLEYVYTRYSTYEVADYDLRLDRHRVLAGVGVGF